MPKAVPFSPLRLFSPIQLAFCFILFFLPWIEMTCTMPASETKNMKKEEIDKAKKEFGIDPTKPISMVSQTGLQIATGGSSPGSDMKKIEAKMKESLKGMGAVETEKPKSKDDDLKGAPLLFLYPVLLIAGIAVAFIPMPPMVRRIALAGCCGAALGVVGLQALIGFPMENEIKKKTDEMKAMGGGGGGFMFGPGGGGPPDKSGKKDTKSEKAEDVIRVSWKFSLYLTLLLLLGAAGTAFLDGLAGAGGRSRYARKGRRDEDDYDDDYDDRPRKKRRDDDYDEDDRPRRKKQEPLSLDDDEPPPPPKKKRSDDDYDDYDDRPKKKKAPEPDFQMPGPAAPPPPAAPAAPAGPNPFAFDDEPPPPKKKPRRRDDDDDDDYDDRPRKRRRRDDDD